MTKNQDDGRSPPLGQLSALAKAAAGRIAKRLSVALGACPLLSSDLSAVADPHGWLLLERAWIRQKDMAGAAQSRLRDDCLQSMLRSEHAPAFIFVTALECGADLFAGFSLEKEAEKETRRRTSPIAYARVLFDDDCSPMLLARRLAMAGAWRELAAVASWMGADPCRRSAWTLMAETVPLGATVAHAAALRLASEPNEWLPVQDCLAKLGSSGITFNAPLFSGASALGAACGEAARDDYYSNELRWDFAANRPVPRGAESSPQPREPSRKPWAFKAKPPTAPLPLKHVPPSFQTFERPTHVPLAALLIDLGADVEGGGPGWKCNGRTPFLSAALSADSALLELLAAKGADIHASWKGELAVHLATHSSGASGKPAQAAQSALLSLAMLGLDLAAPDSRGSSPKERYCVSRFVQSVGSESSDGMIAAAIGRQAFMDMCGNDFDSVLAAVESAAISASLPASAPSATVRSPRL